MKPFRASILGNRYLYFRAYSRRLGYSSPVCVLLDLFALLLHPRVLRARHVVGEKLACFQGGYAL